MLTRFVISYLFVCLQVGALKNVVPFPFRLGDFEKRYRPLTTSEKNQARQDALEMFYFGYNNYMEHAYPADELDPIHCTGRGHDHANPSNININDVLGDYSLTLIDTLNTLLIVGNKSEFKNAVRRVIDNVNFDKDVTVQVFESTIRVAGSLLSSHLILTNENDVFGDLNMTNYKGELLTMAHDLISRLIESFDTPTGMPQLQAGILPGTTNETCLSGAGSLLLEFGVLSRLVSNDIFESLARKAVKKLWKSRHNETNLLGNVIDVQTGRWTGYMSGIGAGLDSFFEYLLKSYIMFGDQEDLDMFTQAYETIQMNLRRGRPHCRDGTNENPPFFLNVDFRDASIANTWVDSLMVSFAGVQVLAGELSEAICLHAFYYAIWNKYEMLPERYDWNTKTSELHFYPLRPEFIESTYMLWLATHSPFYQHCGVQILKSLNQYARSECGYTTIHNVIDKSKEDRMESFFLSETVKYLYLLFDEDNVVNKNHERLLFSTEGHLFPISAKFQKPFEDIYKTKLSSQLNKHAEDQIMVNYYNESCESPLPQDRLGSPLNEFYLNQYLEAVGVSLI